MVSMRKHIFITQVMNTLCLPYEGYKWRVSLHTPLPNFDRKWTNSTVTASGKCGNKGLRDPQGKWLRSVEALVKGKGKSRISSRRRQWVLVVAWRQGVMKETGINPTYSPLYFQKKRPIRILEFVPRWGEYIPWSKWTMVGIARVYCPGLTLVPMHSSPAARMLHVGAHNWHLSRNCLLWKELPHPRVCPLSRGSPLQMTGPCWV